MTELVRVQLADAEERIRDHARLSTGFSLLFAAVPDDETRNILLKRLGRSRHRSQAKTTTQVLLGLFEERTRAMAILDLQARSWDSSQQLAEVLNRRRNALMTRMKRPLLVVLPEDRVAQFALAAPDLFSVRSLLVALVPVFRRDQTLEALRTLDLALSLHRMRLRSPSRSLQDLLLRGPVPSVLEQLRNHGTWAMLDDPGRSWKVPVEGKSLTRESPRRGGARNNEFTGGEPRDLRVELPVPTERPELTRCDFVLVKSLALRAKGDFSSARAVLEAELPRLEPQTRKGTGVDIQLQLRRLDLLGDLSVLKQETNPELDLLSRLRLPSGNRSASARQVVLRRYARPGQRESQLSRGQPPNWIFTRFPKEPKARVDPVVWEQHEEAEFIALTRAYVQLSSALHHGLVTPLNQALRSLRKLSAGVTHQLVVSAIEAANVR